MPSPQYLPIPSPSARLANPTARPSAVEVSAVHAQAGRVLTRLENLVNEAALATARAQSARYSANSPSTEWLEAQAADAQAALAGDEIHHLADLIYSEPARSATALALNAALGRRLDAERSKGQAALSAGAKAYAQRAAEIRAEILQAAETMPEIPRDLASREGRAWADARDRLEDLVGDLRRVVAVARWLAGSDLLLAADPDLGFNPEDGAAILRALRKAGDLTPAM